MVFQPVLAGSKNVDLVYGPNDQVPVCIMNMGDEKKVDLVVTCKNSSGEEVFSKKYPNIELQKGRNVTDLDNMNLSIKKEGYYTFEYKVFESDAK